MYSSINHNRSTQRYFVCFDVKNYFNTFYQNPYTPGTSWSWRLQYTPPCSAILAVQGLVESNRFQSPIAQIICSAEWQSVVKWSFKHPCQLKLFQRPPQCIAMQHLTQVSVTWRKTWQDNKTEPCTMDLDSLRISRRQKCIDGAAQTRNRERETWNTISR